MYEIPLWMILVVGVLFLLGLTGLVVVIARLDRRNLRKKIGQCVKCGYPLRGLTEPRCPECGHQFENSSAQQFKS